MQHCCDRFAEQAAGELQGYPGQFESDEDGKIWNIYGCCGGDCFVVTEMRFCPYCGAALASVQTE